MNNIIETASRIGGLYSNYLRTQEGEMEVLAEIERLSNELRNSGCENAGFFDAILRQGFMHDMITVNNQRASGKSHVYVLHAKDSGLTKIGFSTRVDKRIAEITKMSGAELTLIAKIPAGRDLETEFHRKYGGFRNHGEWFCLMDCHLTEISAHPDNMISRRLRDSRMEGKAA